MLATHLRSIHDFALRRGPALGAALPCRSRWAQAAGAVQARRWSETHWPDGTPKKFQGKDAWKNWINWDAPFREQTDELNRLRHFFFEVDERGAVWRLELDQPDKRFGQMRHQKVIDWFFGYMQQNCTHFYQHDFPFVSLRTHEHYFVRWAVSRHTPKRSTSEAPIVFNDLRDGHLVHSIWGSGEVAGSIATPFQPRSLRLTDDGRLLHPVFTVNKQEALRAQVERPSGLERPDSDAGSSSTAVQRARERLKYYATIDSVTAQAIFSGCEASDEGDFLLEWEGTKVPLRTLDDAQSEG